MDKYIFDKRTTVCGMNSKVTITSELKYRKCKGLGDPFPLLVFKGNITSLDYSYQQRMKISSVCGPTTSAIH